MGRRAIPGDGRRQQILAAAADRFRVLGYHNVGLDEIARTVGLTGPALYRHFTGKQDLLDSAVAAAADDFARVYDRTHADLRALFEEVGAVSVRRRDSVVLWHRESRHLPAPRRRELRTRFRGSLAPLREHIAAVRPESNEDDLDLLVWICQAVFASTGYGSVSVEPDRVVTRLCEAASAVCEVPGLGEVRESRGQTAGDPPRRHLLLPASRREAAIAAAARLFSERGYRGVSMDDIGKAAGITGPSLYHHFPGKAAILATELTRYFDAMTFGLAGLLDRASSPGEALELLLAELVRFDLEHDTVASLLLTESVNLPIEERTAIEGRSADYAAEWVALLTAHRPDLTAGEAGVLVHAALVMVPQLARSRRFRRRASLRNDLVLAGRAILGL